MIVMGQMVLKMGVALVCFIFANWPIRKYAENQCSWKTPSIRKTNHFFRSNKFLTVVTHGSQSNSKWYLQKNNYVRNLQSNLPITNTFFSGAGEGSNWKTHIFNRNGCITRTSRLKIRIYLDGHDKLTSKCGWTNAKEYRETYSAYHSFMTWP